MLVLEKCRGWEYVARGLGARQRSFPSTPPDSSASFSGSWFRVLEFGKRCYSSSSSCFFFCSVSCVCPHLPLGVLTSCGLKLMWFLFISVCCVPRQCCWILPHLNCRHPNFTLLTRWQAALEVPEIPAVSGRIPAFISIWKLLVFYPPRLLTQVL